MALAGVVRRYQKSKQVTFPYQLHIQATKVFLNFDSKIHCLSILEMPGFQLPPIEGVPSLSTIERAAVLDALFEPCDALHTLSIDLLHTENFQSYNDLIANVGVQLTDLAESPSVSDTEWLDNILGAHPRLGAKKVDSAQSQAEQAQLNTGGEEEARILKDLNDDYEKTFPGLKYVYGSI